MPHPLFQLIELLFQRMARLGNALFLLADAPVHLPEKSQFTMFFLLQLHTVIPFPCKPLPNLLQKESISFKFQDFLKLQAGCLVKIQLSVLFTGMQKAQLDIITHGPH